jgi:hypothetical protein
VHRDYSSPGHTCSTSTLSCAATTRLSTAAALHQLRRASGCLGTSRGPSRGSSRRSSSTTLPRAGSLSTTSPPPRVRVPQHVARLVTRLVAPLVVDYSASRRLVVDYFASAARLGASARRAARHAASRAARRQLLRLRRASGCLGTSRGSSRGSSRDSSSTTFVDYFASAARPGASARRVACHAASGAARRRQLRLAQAHCRLLCLHCASGCLGTSRGSSRG